MPETEKKNLAGHPPAVKVGGVRHPQPTPQYIADPNDPGVPQANAVLGDGPAGNVEQNAGDPPKEPPRQRLPSQDKPHAMREKPHVAPQHNIQQPR